MRTRPGFLMRRCLQKSTEIFEQGCVEVGITVRQYDFLFVLDRVDELSQVDLAYILDTDRSTTTLVVGILEKKGYILRRASETDSRKKMVRLTDKGRAAFHRCRPFAEEGRRTMLECLSDDEAEKLFDFLNRIIQNYQISDGADSSAP